MTAFAFPVDKHAYKTVGGQSLSLLTLPGLRPDAPLLYVVHGGGWDSGEASELFCYAPLTRLLRERGWALASVEYRLAHTPEQNHFDEMFDDILDGLTWLAARREAFRFDPRRVVVAGIALFPCSKGSDHFGDGGIALFSVHIAGADGICQQNTKL